MKNLNDYVQRIWNEFDLENKRNLVREMIAVSTATKKTKILTLQKVNKADATGLDKLAINYSLSGMGMKVL